ncbi:MAG: polyvinylalcohol dehydrogenase, partial [Opitutae bacterium]
MMKHLIRTVLSTTSLLALSLQMFAGDWPQWRGADRNDISSETGLLDSWPDNGPKRVWLSDEAGLGYSGFSIVDGKLFTMGLDDSYS